ncbi:hypothetical protein HID58_057021 [Brassica napus]|uniref:Urease accessory protein UreH-like transmembrane domain-containing protein n=1 Tax=Brassica napus TaxID=3708 RepID=A0ABQ8AQU2_BRANA|nr:hypothetical protein HID58_057021 [Brassica napus]
MERLLQPPSSSTISPSKFTSRNPPLLPCLRFVSTYRPESRRVSSISCSNLQSPFVGSNQTNISLNGSPSSSPVAGESNPNHGFFQRIVTTADEQRKTLSTGTVILFSAVDVLLLNPLLASPAYATFQTVAKSGWLTSAWTGFLAGCLHTLSGPDHLAALAPLSIGRTKMESASVGALWGCGHDAGQVIFGLLFLLLKDGLHIEVLQTWGTRIVGNGKRGLDASPKKKKIGLATFATGVVHGLQPDALMTVLPALALPSRLAGFAFLIMFLVGTVVAMGSYTAFIGSCCEALKEKMPRITEKLTWVSSIMAIGLGLGIVISPFFGFNLY